MQEGLLELFSTGQAHRMTETTKEVHRMTAYATSYAVAITAGGTTYNFHVDSVEKVRRIFTESTEVQDFIVQEETHVWGEAPTFRRMTDEEVQGIIWGRISKALASRLMRVSA